MNGLMWPCLDLNAKLMKWVKLNSCGVCGAGFYYDTTEDTCPDCQGWAVLVYVNRRPRHTCDSKCGCISYAELEWGSGYERYFGRIGGH